MPQYITKFTDKRINKDFYLLWSSVIDAPAHFGLGRTEFMSFYERQFGTTSMPELEDRMKRVEETGTSSRLDTLQDLIDSSYAGAKGSRATYQEIVDFYCRARIHPDELGVNIFPDKYEINGQNYNLVDEFHKPDGFFEVLRERRNMAIPWNQTVHQMGDKMAAPALKRGQKLMTEAILAYWK